MRKYILIGILGFGGALCRYGTGILFHTDFPWGTLIVNLAGCFLLPIIFILLQELDSFSKEIIAAMGTGFIGAFTTFSTFTTDFTKLISDGNMVKGSIYLFTSLAGGLIVTAISVKISNYTLDIIRGMGWGRRF